MVSDFVQKILSRKHFLSDHRPQSLARKQKIRSLLWKRFQIIAFRFISSSLRFVSYSAQPYWLWDTLSCSRAKWNRSETMMCLATCAISPGDNGSSAWWIFPSLPPLVGVSIAAITNLQWCEGRKKLGHTFFLEGLFHRLAYTHKLAETLDSQLVHYITTKCVLYMQLLQIKIVRQKVTVTH